MHVVVGGVLDNTTWKLRTNCNYLRDALSDSQVADKLGKIQTLELKLYTYSSRTIDKYFYELKFERK